MSGWAKKPGGEMSLSTVMFLSLIAAVFLHMTYVRGGECPSIDQMGPCECKGGHPHGFEVACNGSQVEEIAEVLVNINHTVVDIQSIRLTNVWLPNLAPNLLLGPNIRYIIIKNCSLSSVSKDSFVQVESTLSELVLSYNALEDVPSHALEKLSKLKMLFLDSNQIQSVRAVAFKGLDSLRYLALYDNKIKFIDNDAFLGLGSSFGYLDLGKNELTTAPCVPLRHLSSLQFLELNKNKIASLDPEEFNAMGAGSLVDLNMANNRIRQLPARTFITMKALANLTVSENSIESIHISAFQGIEGTLKTLLLRDNRLVEVPSAALEHMRVLKTLDLKSNQICKIRKDDFLPYGKTLVNIDLENNSLVYLDPESFIPLKSLNYLWLWSNQLRTVTYETIAPVLGTLKFLDITGNPLHCDCNLSWFEDWMTRQKSDKHEVKCATPEEHANTPLVLIPVDQLVCENGTAKPAEPCCNCNTSTPSEYQFSEPEFSDAVMLGSSCDIIFIHLAITVAISLLIFDCSINVL